MTLFLPEQEVDVGYYTHGHQCCFRHAEISSFILTSVKILSYPSQWDLRVDYNRLIDSENKMVIARMEGGWGIG